MNFLIACHKLQLYRKPQVRPITALCNWREEIKQRTDAAQVNLLWSISDLDDTCFLSPRQRINLDRILRESITNILKHAHPHAISICLNEQSDKLQIIITDDGISTDSSQWQANTGLYSLKTRAEEIAAKLSWDSGGDSSSFEKGTQLTITLPELEKIPYALNTHCR